MALTSDREDSVCSCGDGQEGKAEFSKKIDDSIEILIFSDRFFVRVFFANTYVC